jgi:hypothetical protein
MSRWSKDETGSTTVYYKYGLRQGFCEDKLRIVGITNRSDTDIGIANLVRRDVLYSVANLVCTGGRSGLSLLDVDTWFARFRYDLSVSGLRAWIKKRIASIDTDPKAELEVMIGVLAAQKRRAGAVLPILISDLRGRGGLGLARCAEVALRAFSSGVHASTRRSRTLLPDKVSVPGEFHLWCRIDCYRTRLSPTVLEARSRVLEARLQSLITQGTPSPAEMKGSQLHIDGPGLLPYEVTRLAGNYWVDQMVVAVRIERGSLQFWCQLYGEFDQKRIQDRLEGEGSVVTGGWRELGGLRFRVATNLVQIASKGFFQAAEKSTRDTKWISRNVRTNAEVSLEIPWDGHPFGTGFAKGALVLNGTRCMLQLAYSTRGDASRVEQKLRNLSSAHRDSAVIGSAHGLQESQKNKGAGDAIAYLARVTRRGTTVQVEVDLSSADALTWIRGLYHLRNRLATGR